MKSVTHTQKEKLKGHMSNTAIIQHYSSIKQNNRLTVGLQYAGTENALPGKNNTASFKDSFKPITKSL